MILSLRALPILALPLLVISLAASASEDSRVRTVVKSDGSVGQYQLLPVHQDPAHASVVRNRLALAGLSGSLPSQSSIPATSLPPVRDQGQRGTCAYFATVGIVEASYIAQTPSSSLTLSEECLVDVRNWEFDQGSAYTGKDQPGQRPDPNGDLPASIIQTVTNAGIPASAKYGTTDCTYNGDNTSGVDLSMTDYLATMPSAATAYGKGVTFDQNTAPTIDTIRGLIASGVPVEVGIIVYNEFMSEVDWRFNAKTDTNDDIAGGHAIILTGYSTDSTGKTIFTFKNSWGATWGNAGYGTMDDGVLTNSWGYDPSFDFITSIHS